MGRQPGQPWCPQPRPLRGMDFQPTHIWLTRSVSQICVPSKTNLLCCHSAHSSKILIELRMSHCSAAGGLHNANGHGHSETSEGYLQTERDGTKTLLRRLVQQPGFRGVFYKADEEGGWRAPAVNETCCARTNLADLLDAIGAQGPDALYLRHGIDLAREIQAAGGIITAEDLQSATAVLKDPLVIRVCPAPHSLCKPPTLRQCCPRLGR